MIDAEQIPDLEIQIRLKPQFQGLRGLEPPQVRLKPHLRGIETIIEVGGHRHSGNIPVSRMVNLISLLKMLRSLSNGQ